MTPESVSNLERREHSVTPWRKVAWSLSSVVVLGALFAVGYLPKLHARERLAAAAAAPALRKVVVAKPKALPADRALRLSATLVPYEQTALHARASGFVRRWLVGLGEHVEQGQLLAEIDTPELDRELEQARARLNESEAGLSLARASHEFAVATLQRYRELAANKLTSKQELERCQAEANIAEARVRVAEAEGVSLGSSVKRLEQLKAFARVVAPFAGTITARHVERGALVSAGGEPLFELASTDPLRIGVDVPQSWALGLSRGLEAQLGVAEYPKRKFAAKVARSAGRLDPNTRTLHAELEVPNPDGALLAGMFGNVELSLPNKHEAFSVPSSALLTGKDGTRVAVVGGDGRVTLREVLVERDNGAEVELVSGVRADDRIVINPGSGLRDGLQVEPAG